MSPALALVFAASFGALTSFYLLLSVVPRYAVSVGAGSVGAGLTTGALMLTTTATELSTPWLASRVGQRVAFGAGLVLLGLPALALPASTNLAAIAAVCLVRGVGFAVIVVMGSALVAALAPPERLGEGLGLYGVVVGVPWVAALPLGLWLAAHAGYTVVFVVGALSALAGLAALPGVPAARTAGTPSVGILGALRMTTLRRPAVVFATTAMAGGAIMTFLPLALPEASGNRAAAALLVFAAASTLGRWWTGRHTDRHPARELLAPAVLSAALGTAALVFLGTYAAVVAGMVVAGAGFGVAQNASLTDMFGRAGGASHDMVSAVWNLAYDAGLGVGGFGVGVLVAHFGYPAAFVVTAAVMVAILAFSRRAGPATRRASG